VGNAAVLPFTVLGLHKLQAAHDSGEPRSPGIKSVALLPEIVVLIINPIRDPGRVLSS